MSKKARTPKQRKKQARVATKQRREIYDRQASSIDAMVHGQNKSFPAESSLTALPQEPSNPNLDKKILDGLQDLIRDIQDLGPAAAPVIPPPTPHKFQQEPWRDIEADPNESWLRITCGNCAFVAFTKVKDLKETITALSPYCEQPFGSAADGLKLLRKWEGQVSKAYKELIKEHPEYALEGQSAEEKS